jgi:hypothetical protein
VRHAETRHGIGVMVRESAVSVDSPKVRVNSAVFGSPNTVAIGSPVETLFIKVLVDRASAQASSSVPAYEADYRFIAKVS